MATMDNTTTTAINNNTTKDPSSASIAGLSKIRTKRITGEQTSTGVDISNALPRFADHGEFGFYEGDLISAPPAEGAEGAAGGEGRIRHGHGTMYYDNGDTYTGEFVNDKFQGTMGVYRWHDGDVHSGAWHNGERHGVGAYHNNSAADVDKRGSVEYSKFEDGKAVGEGVSWNAARTVAHKMQDGEVTHEVTLALAKKIAWDAFGLEVPEPSTIITSLVTSTEATTAPVVILIEDASSPTSTPAGSSKTSKPKAAGLLGRLFSSRKVDSDGTLHFKDLGLWGTYEGAVDENGNRMGTGKMTYTDGTSYEGPFEDDKYHGDKGVYRWSDGEEHEGSWKEGMRHGIGIFRQSDGSVDISVYEMNNPKGEGLTFSADRKTAHMLMDGKKAMELLIEEAEAMVVEKFGMAVPEAVIRSEKENGEVLKKIFSKGKMDANGKPMFKDHGEWGSYEGVVDENGKRQGKGKITYTCGNYYDGEFVDDKFHGDKGIHRWYDGDEYEGAWKDGERQGIGIFRSSDGSVNYSMYEGGINVGEGVAWSADRKTAHKMVDGVKKNVISLALAEKMAREKFSLPVPPVSAPPTSPSSAVVPSATRGVGILRRLFSNKKTDANGNPMFKDHGEWGTYDGELDVNGDRHGKGKISYGSSAYYEGGFVNDKFHCEHGIYHWNDGEEYEGAWKDGERHGIGAFRASDGTDIYSKYENGQVRGKGIWWSADRKTAFTLMDGEKKVELLIEEAKELAKEMFNLPIPEIRTVTAKYEAIQRKPDQPNATVTAGNGTTPSEIERHYFVDNGDKGAYEGKLVDGLRNGKGTMSYESGSSYEGDFSNGKFHGLGLYRWSDGAEYEGSWKEGLFHGVGIFRTPNVGVDYSLYEDGYATGVGVSWNANFTKAFLTLDSVRMTETSFENARILAETKFDLPDPCPKRGILSSIARIFQSKRIGPDGKPMFKDYGDWGSYDGIVDEDGKRQGTGKMTYESGANYEGGFVDDKFHCDKGVYRWNDGAEYEGSWKDGERHGAGVFRSADGSVDYSMYKAGSYEGPGVAWSADRKTAYKMVDGVRKDPISLAMAEKVAQDSFNLSVPEPSAIVSSQSTETPASSTGVGILGKLFSKSRVDANGKPMFKDHGEWGTYEGTLDASGKRQGKGKMTYESGNFYEGGFVDDKFHCDKGMYHWSDGEEYEGSWKAGERHGVGIFRAADGCVDYSMYEYGHHKGEGVKFSSDRATATTLLDGEETSEITIEEAEQLVKEKFGL